MTILFLIVTGTLFLCIAWLSYEKRSKYKGIIGLITAVLSALSGSLYFYMQYISGGADQGNEIMQFYLPLVAWIALFVIGIIVFFRNKRRRS